MLDRLFSFFNDLSSSGGTPELSPSDPRLAAAAILFHVMDADGERQENEHRRIADVIAKAYNIEGPALDRLLAAGDEAEQQAVDLYSFTSVLKRNLDNEARIRFIELMWEVVFADGHAHELEDNVVWRIAELIGVSSRDRMVMKKAVAGRLGRDV
ncbi:MAG: TerB family tellurite resistance protein [Phyllobacterium sp.]